MAIGRTSTRRIGSEAEVQVVALQAIALQAIALQGVVKEVVVI